MEIEDIVNEINTFDEKDYYETVNSDSLKENGEFLKLYNDKISTKKEAKAVLGIDIYQYSQYESEKQAFIPVIFKILIDEAKRWCKQYESIIFVNSNLHNIPFIDTGDGGFLIFDNPLQAYTFSIHFYTHLKTFNTGHLYPKFHNFLQDITLRACITYDDVYPMGHNHYGPAIIHNARILSNDKLNRFMIDENTHSWFNSKIGGLDRIKYFTLDELFHDNVQKFKEMRLKNNSVFKIDIKDSLQLSNTEEGEIMNNENVLPHRIECVHVQKIGTIQIKKNILSIYNIETQIVSPISDERDDSKYMLTLTTMGNLNPSGLCV